MYRFGAKSLKVRATLDPRLQDIVDTLLNYVDISLTSGHRTKEEQDALYPKYTKVKYPDSRHNTNPSIAVDFAPHPYPKTEVELWGALGYVAGLAVKIAEEKGVALRWGGDWNRNGSVVDNNFDDLFHLEIVDS